MYQAYHDLEPDSGYPFETAKVSLARFVPAWDRRDKSVLLDHAAPGYRNIREKGLASIQDAEQAVSDRRHGYQFGHFDDCYPGRIFLAERVDGLTSRYQRQYTAFHATQAFANRFDAVSRGNGESLAATMYAHLLPRTHRRFSDIAIRDRGKGPP